MSVDRTRTIKFLVTVQVPAEDFISLSHFSQSFEKTINPDPSNIKWKVTNLKVVNDD